MRFYYTIMELLHPFFLKLLPILVLAVAMVVLYVLIMSVRIAQVKRRMRDYARFICETYIRQGNEVPALFLRYHRQDVETYNTLVSKPFFRNFWKPIHSDILQMGLVENKSTDSESQETEPYGRKK